MSETTAGVVIPTYGRHQVLTTALEHWMRSVHLPEQFLVIDSSPDAGEWRERILKRFSRLFAQEESDYVCVPARSVCSQRNEGIDRLHTDVTMFADDDTFVTPDYLGRIVEVFDADECGEIGGVQGMDSRFLLGRRWLFSDLVRPVKRWYARIYLPKEKAYPKEARVPNCVKRFKLKRRPHLWGACMNFRTHLLKADRFDERMLRYAYAEDFDVSFRIGRHYSLVARMDAQVFHAHEEMGRIPPGQKFLLSWLNPAYLIEKHLPEELTRKALLQKLRFDRRVARLLRDKPLVESYRLAEQMVLTLQSKASSEWVQVYMDIQDYIFDPSSNILLESDFLLWREKRSWWLSCP